MSEEVKWVDCIDNNFYCERRGLEIRCGGNVVLRVPYTSQTIQGPNYLCQTHYDEMLSQEAKTPEKDEMLAEQHPFSADCQVPLSNCCSYPPTENTELCSNCKEHCGWWDDGECTSKATTDYLQEHNSKTIATAWNRINLIPPTVGFDPYPRPK